MFVQLAPSSGLLSVCCDYSAIDYFNTATKTSCNLSARKFKFTDTNLELLFIHQMVKRSVKQIIVILELNSISVSKSCKKIACGFFCSNVKKIQ